MCSLDVKYLKIDSFDSLMIELQSLSSKTLSSVKDYKSEIAKKQHLLGKYMIIKNLNCKEEDILYNKLRKPYIKNNIYFNISHSKDYIVFVSSKNEIGIDIEYIDNKNMDVLDYAFTKKEIEYIKYGKGNFTNDLDRFTLIWTIKESIFKASGTEKIIEPKDIETLVDSFNTNAISDNTVIENKISFIGRDYYVYSIRFNNYIISIASIDKYNDLNLIHQK